VEAGRCSRTGGTAVQLDEMVLADQLSRRRFRLKV
jgi:hypothetical protein